MVKSGEDGLDSSELHESSGVVSYTCSLDAGCV